MQLDDLKQAWAAHGERLERSLAIDERLLRELLLRKVRFALAPYLAWRALEVVLGVAALLVLMPLLAAHAAEPRYLVVGGALAAFTAGITALCARLLVRALRLDHSGPVTAIQREVERLQLAEVRALEWALLGGVVLWLPAALLLFEALTGVDALARVDLAWLAANLVFGLLVLALGQAWARKHVERPGRLVDALSGRSLQAAKRHLAELASFEREESPPS
jgi:hypothetical protein